MKTIAQELKVKHFPFEIKDKNNKIIYYEDSDRYWYKQEYDSFGLIYFEDSNGEIIDNRPKSTPEYTMQELIAKVGFEFKIKK